jgi:hypothetical protein
MRPILFLLFSVIFLLPAQSAQPAQLSGFISKAYLKDTSGNAGIESLAAADFKPYAGNFQMFLRTIPCGCV